MTSHSPGSGVWLSQEEWQRLLAQAGRPQTPLDPKVEAACAAYLLAWPMMSEEARNERRQRMKLALDAAQAVREAG